MGIPEMLKGIITNEEKDFFTQYGTELGTRQIHEKDISIALHRIGSMRKLTNTTIEVLHAMVNKIISSNKALSESSNRHARVMKWFTGALVLAALVQVVVAILRIVK